MNKALKFSVVVCVVSWLMAAIAYFGLGLHNANDKPITYSLFATAYMFLPMLCAMGLQLLSHEKLGSTALLKFKVKWSWLAAWLLPIVILAVTIAVNSLFPGCELEFTHPEPAMTDVPEGQEGLVDLFQNPYFIIVFTLISGLIAGITVNAVAAFGEEYGWRNYLVSALKGKKFWIACLVIGFVWGIWHFPLILMGHNYPEHNVSGVFMMIVMCIALTPIELYLVLKAKSVYPAAILHGTFNAIAGLASLFIIGGNDLLNGAPGLAGIIAMTIVTFVLLAFDRFISKDNIFGNTIEQSLTLNR